MRLGTVLAALVLTGAIALGGAYAYVQWAATTPADPSGNAPGVIFEVPKGATVKQVGRSLASAGLLGSDLVWRTYVRLAGSVPAPKAGRHEVNAGMNIPELLAALSQNPIPEDVPLTLVEGLRLRDTDAFLVEKGLIDPGEYERAASDAAGYTLAFPHEGGSLAGYLLPETYMVPPGRLEVRALVQRQLDQFHARFAGPHAEEIESSKRSLREIVIIASLLEREEPDPATRPAVAGVIERRLDMKIPLGIDATSRFTLDDWSNRRAFIAKLEDPSDPYNTRRRVGLPPGAIGAPSLPSLIAALRPEKSQYLYYLHDSKKQIHFGRNAEEHEANRRRYNVW